jgi:uncharacterized membrane protein
MWELERQLAYIEDYEKWEAIRYYNEYFDEAGPENEARVIEELGSPVRVAAQIKADAAVKGISRTETPPVRKGMSTIWIVLLAILALPVAVPIVLAVLCVGIALLVSAFAVVIALVASALAVGGAGVLVFVAGAAVLFINAPTGIFYMGCGLAAAGIALLLGMLVFAVTGALIGCVARLLNGMRVKSRERHERKAGVYNNE